jgi:arylformamidase
MKLIDLSHTIAPDMTLWSAKAPKPAISAWMTHAQAAASGNYEGCSCEITQVQFVTSIGTYMDSPYHFNPNGPTIDRLKLEQLVLPGVVVDCSGVKAREPIGPERLDGIDVAGKAVLFNTGWSRYWGDPLYYEYPFLTGETAAALRDRSAKLAGVDFLVIDTMTDPRRPVHVTLLHDNILIVENLTNLGALPPDGFVFHAVPVKVAGAAAFPVRAYAVITGEPV